MEGDKQLQGVIPVRLLDGELVWYPPGASDEPRSLDDEVAREQLRATLARQRGAVCFAVPGCDVRLLQLELSAEEKKHIGKSLPFMLEEQVAEDVDHMHFASRSLEKLKLAVALCSNQRMQQWQERLAALPPLQRWIPEPLLLPWQEGEWCLLLEGEHVILRSGECDGFGVERDLAPVLLAAQLAEAGEPAAVVVYGQDQQADIELLPQSLRQRAQWRRGSMGTALMLSDPSDEGINLLQAEFAPRLPLGLWWRQWRMVAAVFAAAFALQLLSTWAEYHNLSQQNLQLRTAIQDSYREVNPRGAAPEPEKQLKRQLASLRGSAQTSGFVTLVEQVGEVVAARAGTTIVSLNYNERGDEMRMNIIASDFEAVEAIREGINRAGLQAEMESSNAQGDKVRARIRVGGSS